MKVAVTTLVSSVAALLALGMVMLYSSSMAQVGARYLTMQLAWCALGLGACLVTALLNYRQLKKIWWLPLLIALVLLALVLDTHFGTRINGARRWFRLWGLSFQPSEFAKIALLIALAWHGDFYRRQVSRWKRGILVPGALIGLTVGLIFLEPDVGNAMVLAAVSGMVLLISGIPLRYFLLPALVAALGVGLFIYHNPTRSGRIYSWLHLEETRRDTGLQAYQSMVALGSGGLTGKGLGDGRQKLGFVPEHHTDFIFSIIGEELGLMVTLAVVAAFVAIIFSGAHIARNAGDLFGMLLASGITFLIGLQAFINIGVVTSALPNKGLPLPFISYGGSSLVIMLGCVGLLLSIARQAGEPDSAMRGGLITNDSANPFARGNQPEP